MFFQKIAISILFIIFVLVLPQRDVSAMQNVSSSLTPTPTEVPYTLPYPGMLPTSPLYFLKIARDRLIAFFIADPLKKAQFDLLQADKRLVSGMSLLNERPVKPDVISATISKGENYFEEAITKTQEAKKQGENTLDFARILLTASQKHEEILKKLITKTSGKLQKDLMNDQERVMNFEKKAKSL